MSSEDRASASDPGEARLKDPEKPAVPVDQIAVRAYELYRARDGEGGRDLDDWLRAERELQ